VAVNVYEGMYILESNRYARDQAAVSGQIPEMIQKLGGEILASRLWEERRLAYSIDGHRKGTYWLTYFKLESSQLASLNRQCTLSESILRTLFLKVDPRIADALVSHALAGGTAPRRSAAEPAVAAAVVVEVGESAAGEPDSDDKS
jgi:small subunit ribosomal protein S6